MSSLRRLARVARHVLFLRPCQPCVEPFHSCHGCEPGRRYCGEECSLLASQERARKARKKYRASPCGREQHRDEEAERRERRRAERVGDRRCEEESAPVQVVAARDAVAEPDNDPQRVGKVEWLLVAWPGLLEVAERMLGEHVACPFCGHSGPVSRVVERETWRWGLDGDGG